MKDKGAEETIVLCCKWCGTEFLAKSRHRLYCSERCKSRSKNAKAKMAKKSEPQAVYVCQWCGKEFTSDRAGRKFCGHDCLHNHMRDLHANNREKIDMTRVLVTKELPLFNELKPVVGAVYEVERYKHRYNTFYIIPDIGGKRIVVRDDECVEV